MLSQIRELQSATSQPLGLVLQCIVSLIASLGIAIYYSWSLLLVTLATVPISAVFLAWVSARIQPGIDGQTEALIDASKCASNAFTAIETVKCFNGQDFEVLQYAEAIKRAAVSYMVQTRANALQIGFVRLTTRAMFAQGFWFGIHLVSTGQKSPGDIVAGFMAALIAAQSIQELLPQIIVMEKGRAAGATLKNMKNEISHISFGGSFHGTERPLSCQGQIEFQDVSLAQGSDRLIAHSL